MTTTTHRPRTLRETGPSVDADLRQLEDQLRRCAQGRGPTRQVRNLADGMRSFATRHVTSVTAVVVLAGPLFRWSQQRARPA